VQLPGGGQAGSFGYGHADGRRQAAPARCAPFPARRYRTRNVRTPPRILPMDTTVSAPIGQLLDGRYLIESQIARGGMATVYHARDIRLDRIVALKIARPELARDQDFVDRFISEARSVARLSSPNVVAVFDQGSTGDLHYIAMEYVPGPTLRDLLAARGRLNPREALDIIERVLAGLAAAHDAGIIHRDVKPENVLLGNGKSVKVADFGLARAAAGVSNTKTGLLIGTAAYLAPEQVASNTSDERSDVYAAGVMLFEMLTGVQPHTGESPLDVAYKHVNSVVPAPSTLVPELPASLDALVALGTSRDPELRPPDARHYLKAITDLRRGTPLPHRPVGGQEAVDHSAWPAAGGTGAAGAAAAGVLAAPPGADPDAPVTGEFLLPDHAQETQRLTGSGAGAHASAGPDGTGPLHGAAAQSAAGGYPGQPGGGYSGATHTLIVPAGLDEDYAGGSRYSGRRHDRAERRYREPMLQRWLFSRRILIVLAVVVVGIAAWWLTSGQYITVPSVADMTVSTARGDLSNAGLVVVLGTPRHSNGVQAGQVISSDPAAGAHISHGGTVTIIPSLGPVEVTVPPVTGQLLAQADQSLKTAGLKPGKPSYQVSTSIPAGVVLSTSPVAGQPWPKDKPVELVVSSGQPLPSFVGQQVSAAQGAAAAGGYSINPVSAASSQPANTIVRQSPAAGTPITHGEVVTVYVSTGPPQVNVPNVDGLNVSQAESELTQAGFQVTVNQLGPGNTVGSYSPTGQAAKGSMITINIGLFGGLGG
jgi:eukaryotic-like serine/threonine-protein kinase